MVRVCAPHPSLIYSLPHTTLRGPHRKLCVCACVRVAARGHLDPAHKQTNITFAETLLRDKPQIVGIQIGINDFMHVDPYASNASAIGNFPV